MDLLQITCTDHGVGDVTGRQRLSGDGASAERPDATGAIHM